MTSARLAAACLVAALAGCADEMAERQARLAPLVGKSETDLIRELGVPTRTAESAGHRFLAYVESRSLLLPGYGPAGPLGYAGGRFISFPGTPPEVIPLVCETTFELVNGLVTSFALHGDGCG